MKMYIKGIATSIFFGCFQTLFYLESSEAISLSDIIFQFSFLKEFIQTPYIVDIALRFLPYFVFQMLFGTFIYQHFCSASIYYFSRCGNRITWLLREALSLYCNTLVYLSCLIAGGVITARVTHTVIFDIESLVLLFYYLLIYSFWLYLTALLINVLAVKFNSSTAFIMTAGIETACIFLLTLWEKILPLDNSKFAGRNLILFKLNPISHLVLSWHSSFYEKLNIKINIYSISYDLNLSAALFMVLSILVTVVGCIIVRRKELIVSNNETGGI